MKIVFSHLNYENCNKNGYTVGNNISGFNATFAANKNEESFDVGDLTVIYGDNARIELFDIMIDNRKTYYSHNPDTLDMILTISEFKEDLVLGDHMAVSHGSNLIFDAAENFILVKCPLI